MSDPIATLRAYLNANLKRHDGSSDEWDAYYSKSEYGDLDNILDLLPDVFAEVERARAADDEPCPCGYIRVRCREHLSDCPLLGEPSSVDAAKVNHAEVDRILTAGYVSAGWTPEKVLAGFDAAHADRGALLTTLSQCQADLAESERVLATTAADQVRGEARLWRELQQCQADLAAMTAERDRLLVHNARHVQDSAHHDAACSRAASLGYPVVTCPECGAKASHYAVTVVVGTPDPNEYRCAAGHFFTPAPGTPGAIIDAALPTAAGDGGG